MKKITAALVLAFVLLTAGCNSGNSSPTVSPSITPTASASPSVTPSTEPSVEPSVPISADEMTIVAYFPFTENVHKTFVGTGNEYAGFESTVDYVTSDAIQLRTNNTGTESVFVYRLDGGTLKLVFRQSETYYRYDYTDQNTMNDIVLMEPLAVGTSWTLANGDTRAITATNATVTVPYGTFDALEVTTTGSTSMMKDYYVLDLGLIKKEFVSNEDPSAPITSELEIYEEGSPLNQNARFYYPDFNNNTVVYIDKTLEFYTGDTVSEVFESEFKSVPAGSGLTLDMPVSAVINSITFETNTGVATIDVSSSFITDMNTGASLEGSILTSIANTLGDYFLTTMVQITVDGAYYVSGHFLFNIGDYLNVDPNSAVPYNP